MTNTGTTRGAEVVQCYVADLEASVPRPPQELKAFAKVWLDPGESTTVTLQLDERAFAFWDDDRARLDGRSPASSSCASARRRATSAGSVTDHARLIGAR